MWCAVVGVAALWWEVKERRGKMGWENNDWLWQSGRNPGMFYPNWVSGFFWEALSDPIGGKCARTKADDFSPTRPGEKENRDSS